MVDSSFIWDVFQQYQIHELSSTLGAAKAVIAEDQAGMLADVGQMQEKVERLALICRSMFELLQEKAGLSEGELIRKIAEVDLRDGYADGKMTAKAKPCPSCEAMISPRFNRCLFCGHRDETGDPFNTVK